MALVKPIGNKVFPIIYCKKYGGHQKFGKTQILLHEVIKCRPARTSFRVCVMVSNTNLERKCCHITNSIYSWRACLELTINLFT
jgi:hypothetical protein